MLPWFTITLFLSAYLLFFVQPMVGKMILPALGGSPAVWNTCMVFFQAILLLGYLYAHGLASRIALRRQILVHGIVLLLPLLVLPISLGQNTSPPVDGNPTWWLLAQLSLGVGLPFFVVSSSAPLLQTWFSNTTHSAAKDPYFLYAASNIGSLLALLGFPLLIESRWDLSQQSFFWFGGYGILILMFLGCGALCWKQQRSGLAVEEEPDELVTLPTKKQVLFWILCAFIPSSLMLGVTSFITTNLAAIPLLWVIPLALYLLTFILVFARRPPISHSFVSRILPIVVLALGPLFFTSVRGSQFFLLAGHLFMFFVAAMASHGALAKSRPTSRFLTQFYLCMSLGGVLGGIFNAILAPIFFTRIVEYPLTMVLVCLIMATRKKRFTGSSITTWPAFSWSNVLWPATMGILCYGLLTFVGVQKNLNPTLGMAIIVIPTAFLCFSFSGKPLRFSLGYGLFLLTIGTYTGSINGDTLYIERNFFGVKRIILADTGDMNYLKHGNTIHGAQYRDKEHRVEPLTYFHRTGPLGDIFRFFSLKNSTPPVGIIGLGIGSIASYAKPGQSFTFYEIDPSVSEIAHDSRYFSFMEDGLGEYDIVLGDGRLTMAKAPEKHYGLIIIDAFSSDSIPVHLITLEALKLYISKLQDDGVLCFHVSNRYLELQPLLASMAKKLGYSCISKIDLVTDDRKIEEKGKASSKYVIMAKSTNNIINVISEKGWKEITKEVPIWTDKYTSIFNLIRL